MQWKNTMLVALCSAVLCGGCNGDASPPAEDDGLEAEREAMRQILDNTEERRALIPQEGTFGELVDEPNEEDER